MLRFITVALAILGVAFQAYGQTDDRTAKKDTAHRSISDNGADDPSDVDERSGQVQAATAVEAIPAVHRQRAPITSVSQGVRHDPSCPSYRGNRRGSTRSELPTGRRYYNGRYYGNFNNRYYGPQYGYF